MRLIDADKMLKRIESWNTSDAMDKALYNFTLNRIIEQPTVDAVPVSFIEEQKAWAEENGFDMYANDLTYLLSVWAERKEE